MLALSIAWNGLLYIYLPYKIASFVYLTGETIYRNGSLVLNTTKKLYNVSTYYLGNTSVEAEEEEEEEVHLRK